MLTEDPLEQRRLPLFYDQRASCIRLMQPSIILNASLFSTPGWSGSTPCTPTRAETRYEASTKASGDDGASGVARQPAGDRLRAHVFAFCAPSGAVSRIRLGTGIVSAAILPAAFAFVADTTNEEHRT